jgi:hypothetical protein
MSSIILALFVMPIVFAAAKLVDASGKSAAITRRQMPTNRRMEQQTAMPL